MKGNITKRGKNSFRLKFDAGIDANGKRKIQYHTFRGTKREAQDQAYGVDGLCRQGLLCRAEQDHGG